MQQFIKTSKIVIMIFKLDLLTIIEISISFSSYRKSLFVVGHENVNLEMLKASHQGASCSLNGDSTGLDAAFNAIRNIH